MQMINGIPEIVEGVAYYSSVTIAKPDFNKVKNIYVVNLAVSDEIFQQFSDASYNTGLKPAGTASFTEDPVVTFQQWENSKYKPRLVDTDNNNIDVAIGNGSRLAVQWKHSEYGEPPRVFRRPILVNAQLIELVPYGEMSESSEPLHSALAF